MKIKHGANSASFRFDGSSIKVFGPTEAAPPSEGFATLQGFVPIARWDIWPGETVVDGSTFRPGLIAYSPNGIEKVVFTCNGTDYTVTEMATNPDSGQLEYFPAIDTTGMSALTQPVEVTAVVHDNNGEQVAFDQPSYPFGSVNPQDTNAVRPGEVSAPFVCVASSPEVVWIAPTGHTPSDPNATKGSESNPYYYGGSGYSALEQLVAAKRPSADAGAQITVPLDIHMHSGTYSNLDLNLDTYSVNSNVILAKWKLKNTGSVGDVIINRRVTISQRSLIEFENVTFDASDVNGNGAEIEYNAWFYESDNTRSVVIFNQCQINGYKLETISINGSNVENWRRPVSATKLVDSVRPYYVNCTIEHGRPNLYWSRGCRIERACNDATSGSFHVDLTIVDFSKTNVPWGYWSDIHGDSWQDWREGGTFENVIFRGWKFYRFHGQGPFFSGGTENFKRIAIIDCDFGLDNTEGSETGMSDGQFVPSPARTVTNGDSYNGTGFSVDQYDGYQQGDPSTWTPADGYDNGRIEDNEQRLAILPGLVAENGDVITQGTCSDWYVKGNTIFSRSSLKHRSFTGAFVDTNLLVTRFVFEDNFDENGKFFVPGSSFTHSRDDRGTFKGLVADPTYLSAYGLSQPDLTTPYSQWIAEQTKLESDPYISKYTTGAIYRTTTGLNRKTQYPGT